MNNDIYENIKILKAYINHAQIFNKINPKISFLIKTFLIEKIPFDKAKMKDDIKLYENEKKKLKLSKKFKINELISYQEYTKILDTIFYNVNSEEKSENVTFNTAAVFRLIADLSDILIIYDKLEVDDEWIKISKFYII